MKRFKFNKPLVISDEVPNTTLPVLWVTVNGSKRIAQIKELVNGVWVPATDIKEEGAIKPFEIDLDDTTHFPGENELLDELKTSTTHCLVYGDDDLVYGTLKVVAEDDTITQEAIYTYESAGTISVIHCERECVDGEWDTWSASV